MSTLIAILGLGFLILIHEAGHFFVARAVGMRPRKFYVGFPPALVKTRRNGIEYGLGSIPLGGYVKIPGMHRPAPSDVDVYFGRAISERPQLFALTTALRRRLEHGEMAGARSELEALRPELAAATLSPGARRSAERGLQELEDALGSEAYWRQRTWRKVAVIAAGPGTNLALAVVLFAILSTIAGGPVTATVDQVQSGRPAAEIGLRPGDRIVRIDGRRVTPTEIRERITASGGKPLDLVVRRDGRRVALGPVRPEKIDGAYRLGFILSASGLSPPAALWQSLKVTGEATKQTAAFLPRLVHRKERKEITTPVGIVQGSSQALHAGFQTYLWLLGFLSLSLALLNLLPLLPLDGGHIAFSLVEGVRGRAVGREVYERVSVVGIALVLMLYFIGLSNDVGRLGGG
ncbi:MAG TPA: site-2 protease family protein [Gaiellaceae bacterium]|nr:site-2 protease family protein [Gaiellaceae bacterium]